jgi:hypothetical protein
MYAARLVARQFAAAAPLNGYIILIIIFFVRLLKELTSDVRLLLGQCGGQCPGSGGGCDARLKHSYLRFQCLASKVGAREKTVAPRVQYCLNPFAEAEESSEVRGSPISVHSRETWLQSRRFASTSCRRCRSCPAPSPDRRPSVLTRLVGVLHHSYVVPHKHSVVRRVSAKPGE